MALVRILVDGYSLLHAWPEIAAGQARHSAAARDELLSILAQYQDFNGTPVTVFFDGGGAPMGTPKVHSTHKLEILYSKAGRTADDMIERTAHRLKPYGEALVVTNDFAERDMIVGMGHHFASCENFIREIGAVLQDMRVEVERICRRERVQFKRPK
jgi:predicted RNA-binding protein with PIN domain